MDEHALFSEANLAEKQPELLPLTGSQWWFFNHNGSNPHHYNITLPIELPTTMRVLSVLKASIQAVIAHHDALRLRFHYDEQGWHQWILPIEENVPFSYFNIANASEAEQLATIKQEATALQANINLIHGPVLQVALFDAGASRPALLLIILHHQIADEYSLSIILKDCQLAFQQISLGKTPRLPPTTTSVKEWAYTVDRLAQTEEIRADLAYWQGLPWSKIAPVQVDFPEKRALNTIGATRSLKRILPQADTLQLLQMATRHLKVTLFDVLLTAFVQTFARRERCQAVQVCVVSHGRDPSTFDPGLDFSRTINNMLHGNEHIVLELPENASSQENIYAIRNQFKAIPHDGYSDDWLTYCCHDASIRQQMLHLPEYEIVFNYHGRTLLPPMHSKFLDKVRALEIPDQDAENIRSGLLLCQIYLVNNQLHTIWEYSSQLFKESTIVTLAESYLSCLQEINVG